MTNTTKKIFVASLLTTLVSIGGMMFFFLEIRAEGLRLEEQIAVLSESTTKESAYLRLVRLAQETEAERLSLAKGFFKEEGDSIAFLGEIETLASTLGLKLRTNNLEKVVDKTTKQERIVINFIFSGQKDIVFNFSKLMEVAPYHSLVENLSLRKMQEANEWEGNLTMSITINSL